MRQYKDTEYYVLEDGTIIGKYGKILKPRTRGNYLCVKIDNNNISIHRIVAESYLPNPNNKEQVNHIDGNKSNNNYSNLEWVTRSENQLHAYKLGLQKPNKKLDDSIIISEYKNGLNGLQISKKYSVNFKRIYSVIKKYKQS